MSIEMSKATDANKSENNGISNLNLPEDSPLIKKLEGVFLIGQYKDGNLVGIWFLDDDKVWKEATPLEKYLSVQKSIPDKQATIKAYIASYPPLILQKLEDQIKGNQHAFILDLLKMPQSKVANSTELKHWCALLDFPPLEIERIPNTFITEDLFPPLPTKAVAKEETPSTQPSIVKKIVTKIADVLRRLTKSAKPKVSEKQTATSNAPAEQKATPLSESTADLEVPPSKVATGKKKSKKESTPPKEATVTVTGIEWSLGKDRKLVPSIYFNPVKLGNSEYSKVDGYSIGFLEDKKIRVGANIKVGIDDASEDAAPKFLKTEKTSSSKNTPVANLSGLERKGPDYIWSDETLKEAEQNIETFLKYMGIEEPPEVSEAIVKGLRITDASQLIADVRENGAEKLFKDSINANGISGEKIYHEILAAINRPIDWWSLILASGTFNIKEIGEPLMDKLIASGTITVGDLFTPKPVGKLYFRGSLTASLKALGFNDNNLKTLRSGVEEFNDWWEENRNNFAQNVPIPKAIPTLLHIAVPSNDSKLISTLEEKLGIKIVPVQKDALKDKKGKQDKNIIIIAKDEDEQQKLKLEGLDAKLVDEFLKEYQEKGN